jgi:prepilin-type N-terminal cleavage/methylation domain-containing protein
MRRYRHLLAASQFPGVHLDDNEAMRNDDFIHSRGFSLVEALMAILILSIGFMFIGQVMVGSVGTSALARSKGTAGVAATNKLETLALKYRANVSDSDLTLGGHGPEQVEIINPRDNSKVNRYNLNWTVSSVSDPRSVTLRAVRVTVTVTPIGSGTATNNKVGLNKVLNVSTIFSFRSS